MVYKGRPVNPMQFRYLIPKCTHWCDVWLASHHLIPLGTIPIVIATQTFAPTLRPGKLWEPAPKCHRVTRQAGHQKVTKECHYEFRSHHCPIYLTQRYPSAYILQGN
jgi:hypothetical protein